MIARTQPRVVFCDLDDTLFDHAGATRDALAVVRERAPALAGWSLQTIDERHRVLLESLHLEVLAGRMSVDAARLERFRRLLADADAEPSEELTTAIALGYRRAYELAWREVEGARRLMHAIKDAGVGLVIVTNNGVDEQRMKMSHCRFTDAIDVLVTSEEVGSAKPGVEIFHRALSSASATAAEAVMFGDAWGTDIVGARAAGIRPVWFNPAAALSPDPSVAEIRSLLPTEAALRTLLAPNAA